MVLGSHIHQPGNLATSMVVVCKRAVLSCILNCVAISDSRRHSIFLLLWSFQRIDTFLQAYVPWNLSAALNSFAPVVHDCIVIFVLCAVLGEEGYLWSAAEELDRVISGQLCWDYGHCQACCSDWASNCSTICCEGLGCEDELAIRPSAHQRHPW